MPDIVRVLLLMSGDNWLLGQDSIGEGIALISSVEHDPLLSPTTGWFFYNERGDCIEDPSLTLPSTSPTRFELLVGEETDGSPCVPTSSLKRNAREWWSSVVQVGKLKSLFRYQWYRWTQNCRTYPSPANNEFMWKLCIWKNIQISFKYLGGVWKLCLEAFQFLGVPWNTPTFLYILEAWKHFIWSISMSWYIRL